MRPTDFHDLLSGLVEGDIEPNVVDMLMMLQFSAAESEVPDAPDIAEIADLAQLAFGEDPASFPAAQVILFALRQSVAADEIGDRAAGVLHSEEILRYIHAESFPITAGGAHLKIGGALAAQAGSEDGVDTDALRRAVTHLESALSLLPDEQADMRAMADYNAALALNSLWQEVDDWDSDEGLRDRALRHALAAVDAMDRGVRAGSRSSVSYVVLNILLADGEPRDDEARAQVIDFLDGWLNSPEGRAMPVDQRSTLADLRDTLVS